MKFGIVTFPGSNCDWDCYRLATHVLKQKAVFIWHKEKKLPKVDVCILPGGFSYGDYLRTGAIARFSPVMNEVVKFANAGGKVVGICNGFQILTESGLLPGVLMRNSGLQFICDDVLLCVENTSTCFTKAYGRGESCIRPHQGRSQGSPLQIRMPIAHGEGNYFADEKTLDRLEGEGRVIFRYLQNPNGSQRNIAGIINEKGNVLGMMPHPERCAELALGNVDGKKLFESLLT